MKPFLIYLVIINAVGYLLMTLDKAYAIKKRQRIPEATLFSVAILGGSLGCIVGMYFVRHKTKHTTFVVGMPAILLVQLILYYFTYMNTVGP